MEQENKIFLIGADIKHSKSPELFSAAYPNTDIKYELFETDDFQKSIQTIQSMDCNVIGVSVASPFKHRACELGLDFTQTTEIGYTANCLRFESPNIKLKFKPADTIKSYNSDLYALKCACKNKQISNVCVIGAGAIGRMCVQYFESLNIHSVTWYNRTVNNIVKIIESKHFKLSHSSQTKIFVKSLDEIFLDDMQYDTIVWALPVCSPELGVLIGIKAPNAFIIEPNYTSPTFNHKSTENLYDGKQWLLDQAIIGFTWLAKIVPNIENMKKIMQTW